LPEPEKHVDEKNDGYFGRFKGIVGSALSYVKPTTTYEQDPHPESVKHLL